MPQCAAAKKTPGLQGDGGGIPAMVRGVLELDDGTASTTARRTVETHPQDATDKARRGRNDAGIASQI